MTKDILKIQEVKPEVSASVKTIPPELEPLAKEARKYKSAEEFIEKGLPYTDIKGANQKLFVKTKEGWLKGEVISYPTGFRARNAQVKLENKKIKSFNIYDLNFNRFRKNPLGMTKQELADFYNQAANCRE